MRSLDTQAVNARYEGRAKLITKLDGLAAPTPGLSASALFSELARFSQKHPPVQTRVISQQFTSHKPQAVSPDIGMAATPQVEVRSDLP